MVFRLFGAKPLSEPQMTSNNIENSDIFIQENAFENVVCETTAILSRPQCVNLVRPEYSGFTPLHNLAKPFSWLRYGYI